MRWRPRPSQSMPQPGTRSHSPLRAAGPARLLHLAPAAVLASAFAAVRPCAPELRGPLGCQSLVAGLRRLCGAERQWRARGSSSLPAPRLRPPRAPPPAPLLSALRPAPGARAASASGSGCALG